MKKFVTGLLAAAVSIGLMATPAVAQEDLPTAVDVVIEVSGAEGFDRNRADYDLLRDALVATNLVEAVAGLEDVTIFAPTDMAFIRLARSLGYTGFDEAGTFGFLAAATGYVSPDEPGLLDDVLLYHVGVGSSSTGDLMMDGSISTLLGADLGISGMRVIDADPDYRNAKFVEPMNLLTANGYVHTVSQVLRPLDL